MIAVDRDASGSLVAVSGLASYDIAGVMRKRPLELASPGDQQPADFPLRPRAQGVQKGRLAASPWLPLSLRVEGVRG